MFTCIKYAFCLLFSSVDHFCVVFFMQFIPALNVMKNIKEKKGKKRKVMKRKNTKKRKQKKIQEEIKNEKKGKEKEKKLKQNEKKKEKRWGKMKKEKKATKYQRYLQSSNSDLLPFFFCQKIFSDISEGNV